MTDDRHARPFDPGLQPERTLLAWQRTCLALAVGNTVAIRYMSDEVGLWAAAVGVAGLALSVAAWILVTIRYRRVHLGLVREETLVTDGRMPLLVGAAVLAACAAGGVMLVAFWRPW